MNRLAPLSFSKYELNEPIMAKIYKKYGIYGQSEYVALVGTKRIVFKGGYSGTRGTSPASYTTSNEEEQHMIECCDKWFKGIIVLVEQWQEQGEEPAVAKAEDTAVIDQNTYPEVTNMQGAIKVLVSDPYNVSLTELQNKVAVKGAALKIGVNFPNWK